MSITKKELLLLIASLEKRIEKLESGPAANYPPFWLKTPYNNWTYIR